MKKSNVVIKSFSALPTYDSQNTYLGSLIESQLVKKMHNRTSHKEAAFHN